MSEIDIVICWVDDSDPEWQEQKENYKNKETADVKTEKMASNKAYRDWGLLKYWFRSIEKHAPWVRKIHFVTYGHYPAWLNTLHPKLNIVNHEDFIPRESLPTFNSRAIEVNFHKIKGLSNQFIYFNDDFYLNNFVDKEDFFYNDLPVDIGVLSPIKPELYGTANVQINNTAIVNSHFDFKIQFKQNLWKWFNIKYGLKNFRTLFLCNFSLFMGFYEPHLPTPFLKETFEKVWELEEEILTNTSNSKFKNDNNVNQWLFRYWQLSEGKFYPRSNNVGKYYQLSFNNDELLRDIEKGTHRLICINDTYESIDFFKTKKELLTVFENKYPEKSKFEV